jgi:type I restriction enzyme R subunit
MVRVSIVVPNPSYFQRSCFREVRVGDTKATTPCSSQVLSRELLASIKARLGELDRFWEKEQTKADVEVFILDAVFANLPTPPFTTEKKNISASVYVHVWQQAMNGRFSMSGTH